MLVTNPEEYQKFITKGAADPELKAPLVIPDPTTAVENKSLYRYCSDDAVCGHSTVAGCRRNETMLKWEEEFNSLLPADITWGARDQFFFQDTKIYYYKPLLEKLLEDDAVNFVEDRKDPAFLSFLSNSSPYSNELIELINGTIISLDGIRTMIASNPNGMPKFIEETNSFLVFETPGNILVTEITSDLLSLIKTTFTSDYQISWLDSADSFYIKDGKVYWTDLLRWVKITSNVLKLGINLNNTFYAFDILTTEARQVITLIGFVIIEPS
jgi:hypothetical protein